LVWTLLAVVLICGVTGLEAWPFSGFRLFSQVRTSHSLSWRLATVDHAGNERTLRFGSLPPGFRGLNLELRAAGAAVPAGRAALCQAMVDGARSTGRDVVFVRVYAVERDLSRRVGRTSRATSHLAFKCEGRTGGDANG
jgi:hypothetical protein